MPLRSYISVIFNLRCIYEVERDKKKNEEKGRRVVHVLVLRNLSYYDDIFISLYEGPSNLFFIFSLQLFIVLFFRYLKYVEGYASFFNVVLFLYIVKS